MSEPAIIKGYRQAGQLGALPDVSFSKMFRLALRTWPFMRPMLKHLILLGVVTITGSAVALVAFIINADIFGNKVLVGNKLQPMQATILFLDESYVDPSISNSLGQDLGEQLGVSKLLGNITGGKSKDGKGERSWEDYMLSPLSLTKPVGWIVSFLVGLVVKGTLDR